MLRRKTRYFQRQCNALVKQQKEEHERKMREDSFYRKMYEAEQNLLRNITVDLYCPSNVFYGINRIVEDN